MTALRLISLPTHAVLELALGVAVLAAPFALGFGPAGLVIAVTLGALIVGLALSAAPDTGTSVAAHFAFDRAIALGLVFGALALALADDAPAAAFLAGAAVAHTVLNLITRYTART